MEIIPKLIIVLLLVFLNGFFVASEFALVGVRKTRIAELVKKGNVTAKLVDKALSDLDSFISSTQLGITIASLALGWVGEPVLANFFEQFFTFLPEEAAFFSAHGVSIATAFSVITFLHIVLGELAPKTVALQRAEMTSLLVIAPLTAFTKLFRPVIWVLNGAGSLVLRIFGLHAPSGHQLVHSEEEIKMILAQSGKSGAIEQKEVEMVYNVFSLSDIPIRKIMIQKRKMVALNINLTLQQVEKKLGHPHSRFPVYKESIDHIVGYAHVKDIYKALRKLDSHTTLQQANIVRAILSVPDNRKADEVLLDMRKKNVHIAVVKSTKHRGKTVGMVTLEDIVESLVGEIKDEFEP